jgi:hypothetical protein
MAKNHNKKYTRKLRHRLGTQEDCDRINKGGVTLILMNRHSKKLELKDKK